MVVFMRRRVGTPYQALRVLQRAMASYCSSSSPAIPQPLSPVSDAALQMMHGSRESSPQKITSEENAALCFASLPSPSSLLGLSGTSCSGSWCADGLDLQQPYKNYRSWHRNAGEEVGIAFSDLGNGTGNMADSNRFLGVMPHSLVGAYSLEIRKQCENSDDVCTFTLEDVHDRRILAIINQPTIMEALQRVLGREIAVDLDFCISDCGKLTKQLEWGKLIQQQVKVSDFGNTYKHMDAGQIKTLMPGLQHQNFPLEASSVKKKRKKKMNKHKQRKLRRRDRHRK